MVYREAVAVKLGYKADEKPGQTPATQVASPAAQVQVTRPAGIDYYINPLQLHVTLAGLAAAMGLFAIGLSLRAVATSPHWRDPELDRAGVSAMPNPQRGGAYDVALLRSFAPQVEVTGEVELIPAARFWLLVFLVSAITSLAGWWVLAKAHQTFKPQELWKLVTADGYVRRLAHVIGAGTVITLPLLLALLARIARKSRFTIGLFSLLLVAAVAAQVWLGILLLFDRAKVTPDGGPWYRLQNPTASIATTRSSP
jgi:hypothetical protein